GCLQGGCAAGQIDEVERAAAASRWTDGGDERRARRGRDPGAPACDGVARCRRCKGDEMWRGFLGTIRDRGRGAAGGTGSGGQPAVAAGQEERMRSGPEAAPTPPDVTQRPDVSRETWTAAPPESWADEAELDT